MPADDLLGGCEGQRFYRLMGNPSYERLIGVTALTCVEDAYEAMLRDVCEREAFGPPMAEFLSTWCKLAR